MKNGYENLEEQLRHKAGFKNDENVRHPVQNEIAVMKEEIQNIKVGRAAQLAAKPVLGWDSDLGPSVFGRLPPPAARLSDTWFSKGTRVQEVESGFHKEEHSGDSRRSSENHPG